MKITEVESAKALPALGEAATALAGHFPDQESRHVLAMFSAFINALCNSPNSWPTLVRPHELREALLRAEDAEMSRDAIARKLANMVDADVVEVKQRRATDVLNTLVDWWHSLSNPHQDWMSSTVELEKIVTDARRFTEGK